MSEVKSKVKEAKSEVIVWMWMREINIIIICWWCSAVKGEWGVIAEFGEWIQNVHKKWNSDVHVMMSKMMVNEKEVKYEIQKYFSGNGETGRLFKHLGSNLSKEYVNQNSKVVEGVFTR